ncbi:hypothetical protein [Xanthomonas vasicola]|uniref:Uncharacterized protein n=1 Tax=Xanthomonas vasicola TaxID=56459 RepID=A0ABD7S9V2_XANVA|nr:hypothetical protein [Xanthomonas vasicola]AZR21592.1 hypothetical protein NX81_003645 [Xanthomonas vasicola]KGR45243.1 hypothetical protein NX04_05780 [Xanthomonas vasicola]KGR47425.1 hypothetical protein NX05_03180 [Xanthomonas vasicola]KGR60847.1 hypothetical protein NX79_08565 [Xanthomonas vasicola]MDO6985521.1 hypothetical protein [Xanthomonas vasicola]
MRKTGLPCDPGAGGKWLLDNAGMDEVVARLIAWLGAIAWTCSSALFQSQRTSVLELHTSGTAQ